MVDPNALKEPAEWAGYIQAIVAAAVVVFGAIASATKRGREWAARMWKRLAGKPRTAKADLRFVTSDRETCWSRGTLGADEIAIFNGVWHVTNVSESPVSVLKFRVQGLVTENHLLVVDPALGRRPGYVVAPGKISQVGMQCMLRKAMKGKQPVVADVIFTDNFGDEHKVRRVQFKHRGA
jgi:hypothetical protein